MDPECCYLGFEVALSTTASVETVRAVFDFVSDESDIRVLHPGVTGPLEDLVASHGLAGERVRRFLTRTGALVADHDPGTTVPGFPADPDPAPQVATPVCPIPSQPRPAEAESPRTAVEDVPRGGELRGEVRNTDNRNIRVNALRLDRLIDAVGELVIAGAAARLRAANAGSDDLQEAMGDVMRLVEEVRDSALQLRMVPIGTTFSRFQRVVRDVSTELGKDISLVISGGDTEVDKALVEQIGDPLLHLVRNSIDHGIESPEVRVATGKPARGTLRLNAFHDSGSIVIEVQDDGAGIDRDQVLVRALECGLVDPGANLTDAEVNALIFEPGLSTASELSNLSGRGVGMDVVKRNVTALRGTIDVESILGRGTTIRIRLPLTLAIIDGFLVGVGRTAFVIPLDRVVECVELPGTLGESRECMDLRGEVLPFVRLRSRFGIPGDRPRRENVVVVDHAGTKTGLVVDSLMGEFQTVIKPLGRLFQHVRGIGGATILGDGEVALILDVPMLVRHRADQAQDQFV
jgi:two-component system chemotaxis sensor kinase CheA